MPPKKKTDVNMDPMLKIMEADLSDNSKENYKMRAHTLEKKSGKPLMYIIIHPEIYIEELHKWYPKNTSCKAHLSFILSIFRYNQDIMCDNRKIYEKWSDEFNETHKRVMDRYETNKPTERQAEGFVDYADIIKKRDELEGGSIERLLLGFYTHLRPRRCEYGKIYIYTNKLPSEKERESNYIQINGDKATLHLGTYKTSKTYNDYEIELPEPLLKDLKLSLKNNDRDWLFVDINGKPYNRNSYCAFTLRVFKKLFNKPLTTSLIRHIYISSELNMNKLSIKEKKEIAQDMAHNIHTQDTYRLIFKE